MEQWKSEYPEETKHLERLTVTPRREDVDKFIIRKAVDAAKSGCLVKIVSNDNFRDYIGQVTDFPFTEDWVHKHVPDLVQRGGQVWLDCCTSFVLPLLFDKLFEFDCLCLNCLTKS